VVISIVEVHLVTYYYPNIIHRDGTILESLRCEEFKMVERRQKAIRILQEQGIEGIIAIDGDKTFHGA
jgi:6-phosphofructokinase 1